MNNGICSQRVTSNRIFWKVFCCVYSIERLGEHNCDICHKIEEIKIHAPKTAAGESSPAACKCLFFIEGCSLSKLWIQNLFADTQVMGSYLQKLIRIDEIQSLLQA